MNKNCTSLEQSQKLAEILPIESADMCFNISQRSNMPPLMTPYSKFNEFFNMETPDFLIPCWSLSALLDVINQVKEINHQRVTILVGRYAGGRWYVETLRVQDEKSVVLEYSKELVDACYEMILRLHEQKLL